MVTLKEKWYGIVAGNLQQSYKSLRCTCARLRVELEKETKVADSNFINWQDELERADDLAKKLAGYQRMEDEGRFIQPMIDNTRNHAAQIRIRELEGEVKHLTSRLIIALVRKPNVY